MSKVWVTIKEEETGNIVSVLDEYTDLEACEYLWSEGNWSCDCNRQEKMYPGSGEIACTDFRFHVNLKRDGSDDNFYQEFEE